MQLSIKAALLAAASSTAVSAFSDSSPFILLSTAELATTHNNNLQLQPVSQVLEAAKDVLSGCPTSKYLIVSVPNLHAADMRDDSHFKMPALQRAITDKNLHEGLSVAEVIGQISTGPLDDYIQKTCQGANKKDVKVEMKELKHLLPLVHGKDSGKRAEVLADNDREIGRLLDDIEGDVTLILLSDPNEFQAYEPDFVAPMMHAQPHLDLKREVEAEVLTAAGARRAAEKNSTKRDTWPLFEKYQFFTPGVFMGLFVLIILLSILGAGISALGSLQVSYGAFDKEMGPAAQKKQM